jgi:hypothetical protein
LKTIFAETTESRDSALLPYSGSESTLLFIRIETALGESSLLERPINVKSNATLNLEQEVVMPTPEEDLALTRAAESDPDNPPLSDEELARLVPMEDFIKTLPSKQQREWQMFLELSRAGKLTIEASKD